MVNQYKSKGVTMYTPNGDKNVTTTK